MPAAALLPVVRGREEKEKTMLKFHVQGQVQKLETDPKLPSMGRIYVACAGSSSEGLQKGEELSPAMVLVGLGEMKAVSVGQEIDIQGEVQHFRRTFEGRNGRTGWNMETRFLGRKIGSAVSK